jgi:hypothetical protein
MSSAVRGSELVPVLLEQNGKDELRFVPSCAGCGELIHDLTEANVAVVGGSSARPKPAGTYRGAKLFRLDGIANVFCWECDSKTHGNLPWVNAAAVFRNHDDAAQQRLEPTFRSVTR